MTSKPRVGLTKSETESRAHEKWNRESGSRKVKLGVKKPGTWKGIWNS